MTEFLKLNTSSLFEPNSRKALEKPVDHSLWNRRIGWGKANVAQAIMPYGEPPDRQPVLLADVKVRQD